MISIKSIPALTVSFVLLFLLSCNQSNEQREFENQAISFPQNITETDESGAISEGNEDPDDWRIAPFFQGVVSLEPLPYPNPLLPDQRLTLNIYVTGVDGVSGLRVIVLNNENNVRPVYDSAISPLPTGLTSISLAAGEIGRFVNNPEGLYRIIVEDRNGAIITYGDVRIE